MPQHRDQPTNSQPPNDPMGFGGEKAKPGAGKYPADQPVADQDTLGVPGAFGDALPDEDPTSDVPKGDEVAIETGMGDPSDEPGIAAAERGGRHPKEAKG